MTEPTQKVSAADALRGALGLSTDADAAGSSDPIVRAAELQNEYGAQSRSEPTESEPLPLNGNRVIDAVSAALRGDTSAPMSTSTAQLVRSLVEPDPTVGRSE
ncbi:hypothetical protein GTV32_02745 [Gordonia sp. SID5947]|uniref:hypothetical protein n=1 Tax=Gordonia sp. SID5947 TaxID=2690315 RepID=UPI001371DC92|nr:hypothetical protein [Gordonia sp. SID5947]MYR05303.1 hypothetical protein [Gordonia sp. SID5947]